VETIKRSVVSRKWREAWVHTWSTEEFQGSEITLYDTIMVDICHYKMAHTCRIYYTEYNASDGLWMIIYQYIFINYNKLSTVGGMFINMCVGRVARGHRGTETLL
jgi:hypothetical protein